MPVSQPVSVPLAMDMDDETFAKHLRARHPDLDFNGGTERELVFSQAVVKTVRAYHNRLHREADNGVLTGHYHVDACELCGSVEGRDGFLLHFKEDCFK